jgi:hypothetical protein
MKMNKTAVRSIYMAFASMFGMLLACSTLNPELVGEVEGGQLEATITSQAEADITEVAGSSIQLTQAPGDRPGSISFDLASATFNGDSIGLQVGCWPPNPGGTLVLAGTGVIVGSCSGEADAFTRLDGVINGNYDAASGNVNFTMDATSTRKAEVGDGTATITVSFAGSAPLVGGTTATGSATFVYTCASQGEGITCAGGNSEMQTTGQVPFTLQFNP